MKICKLLFLLLLLPLTVAAQTEQKYLKGAVPVNEQGVVVFSHTYDVPNTNKTEIFKRLTDFTQQQLIKGENALPQCRIVENDEANGLLAARIEEYLYFKKKAWVTHRTRFFYDVIYQVEDNKFTVSLQRLHYIYEPEETPNDKLQDYRAEDWITDANALNPKGQLTRMAGKFRRFTIDRKNEIFREAAKAAGAQLKTRTVVVEE